MQPALSEGSNGTMRRGLLARHGEISPTRAEKSAPTVLVVDDEPLVRWSVKETLGALGYRVVEAADALSAMCALSPPGGSADVVLLDLHLPDAKDLRVLSAIHRLAPATPIILMTVYGTRELFAEARARGAFAAVDKPFEMADLAPLVAAALASRPS